jgi:hypothetical protein
MGDDPDRYVVGKRFAVERVPASVILVHLPERAVSGKAWTGTAKLVKTNPRSKGRERLHRGATA